MPNTPDPLARCKTCGNHNINCICEPEVTTQWCFLGEPNLIASFVYANSHLYEESTLFATIEYETNIIDAIEQPSRRATAPALSQTTQVALSARGARAHSRLHQTGFTRFADPRRQPVVQLDDESYAIASTLDASVRSALGTGLSKAIAFQLLEAHLAIHPEDRGYLQVVPLAEVEAAA